MSGCVDRNTAKFKLEPDLKASAYTQIPLKVGDVLGFTALNIKNTEELIFQKCGVPCNTAKVISEWDASDFQKNETQWITLTESGHYYFWILKTLENGEIGPVYGESESNQAELYTVHYVSGTSVLIKFDTSVTEK